jgi:murein DD-endopeptidase MepM/ murein hydrolase activator NlpD
VGFHSGVDIQVPDGTPVYAIEAGVVTRVDKTAIAVSSPDLSKTPPLVFGYWHIVPAVTPFQFVFAGELLGHVAARFGHVHLAERRDGRYVNPLRRGGLTPYADHTAPVVGPLVVYRAGTDEELSLTDVTGRVDLAVEATDPPPIRPRPPWEHVVLSPETLSWGGLYDGAWVPYGFHPLSVDFRSFLRLPLDEVYAAGTHMNEPNRPGDYRFWLVHGIDTTMLGDGLHAIWVTATDVRGNRTTRTLTFDVTNPGPFSASAGTRDRP